MNTASMLRHQAVNAAKHGDWQQAAVLNTSILEQNPKDTHALNRLGVACLQLKDVPKATNTFKRVLEIDKTNAIAKRHLDRIKDNSTNSAPTFTNQNFIEEPGKTKSVELHRLAGRPVLNKLSVGQMCQLKIKKRYISVEANDTYIGALPEDLSFRLTKLIETGNEYTCSVRSCNGTQCCVYLRESVRSETNKDIHSFPPSKSSISPINDIDEGVAFDDALSSDSSEMDGDDVDNKRLDESDSSDDMDD